LGRAMGHWVARDAARPRVARARSVVAAASASFLSGCAGAPSAPARQPSMLDTAGPRAAEIAWLWWLMLGIATVVYVVVVALLLHALFRSRPAEPHPSRPSRLAAWLGEPLARLAGATFVSVGGIVVPAIILVVLMVVTVRTMAALSAPAGSPEFTVVVTGYQYWFEVRYPDRDVVTANEVHVPVGQPVRLAVTAVDVIHSFWVPQLQDKLDMIPGRTNTTWFQADAPGVYWGECTEYCGTAHARMAFVVVAEPREQFLAWLEQQRQPAAAPTDPVAQRGVQAFARERCINCHVIRYGSDRAGGNAGPDLTHVGGRRTIAAGTLPTNRDTLAAWIADPQRLKPGNLMPNLDDATAAREIAAYLEGLK
jgi:cytochrome c oxidase subunit 2